VADLACPLGCDNGWHQVSAEYVDRTLPWPNPDDYADDDAYDAAIDYQRERRAAAAQTFYPCRRCRAGLFYRWVNHYGEEHNEHTCDQCQDVARGRKVTLPIDQSAPATPTRKDLE
jgi:hypothetical protein